MCNQGVVPIVLAHARALLTSGPQGGTAYLDADLRDPDGILQDPQLLATLDLTRPVALSLIGIVHFIPDDAQALAVVRRLVDALPAGSYLALTHGTADADPERQKAAESYRQRGMGARLRRRAEIERFFDGLELVDPGLVMAHRWHPDDDTAGTLTDAEVSIYGAVARLP